uniref:Uncharacterized protein n=1 Tax=Candidatus Kentrum sp. TC TaxID=2126339 RepID=A0A450YX49_9GAMM|nr:MAG: hypothetical protein BECKTC1821E_GA0114239_105921 [Candidatus Kentron sp. TC]
MAFGHLQNQQLHHFQIEKIVLYAPDRRSSLLQNPLHDQHAYESTSILGQVAEYSNALFYLLNLEHISNFINHASNTCCIIYNNRLMYPSYP